MLGLGAGKLFPWAVVLNQCAIDGFSEMFDVLLGNSQYYS